MSKSILFGLLLALAGCTAQPRVSDVMAQRHAANVATAQDLGYQVISKDGQTLFCNAQAPTGSHLAPGCLTEREWEQRQLWVWSGPWCPAAFEACTERNHRLVTITAGAPY